MVLVAVRDSDFSAPRLREIRDDPTKNTIVPRTFFDFRRIGALELTWPP